MTIETLPPAADMDDIANLQTQIDAINEILRVFRIHILGIESIPSLEAPVLSFTSNLVQRDKLLEEAGNAV